MCSYPRCSIFIKWCSKEWSVKISSLKISPIQNIIIQKVKNIKNISKLQQKDSTHRRKISDNCILYLFYFVFHYYLFYLFHKKKIIPHSSCFSWILFSWMYFDVNTSIEIFCFRAVFRCPPSQSTVFVREQSGGQSVVVSVRINKH